MSILIYYIFIKNIIITFLFTIVIIDKFLNFKMIIFFIELFNLKITL
jgi:hypothetical protein